MADSIDDIDISSLLRSYDDRGAKTLRQLFDLKLNELSINQTQALDIMGIEVRALNAVVDGTGTRIDLTSLLKLAKFLDITQEETVGLYLKSMKDSANDQLQEIDKKKFILQNFDLTQLKQAGIIDTTSDFGKIESILINLFDYKSIFDYRKDVINPAFSSAKLHKQNRMTDYWVEFARGIFQHINNRHSYNQKALVDYFPKIRWHSLDTENGLSQIIKAFYKFGITVIYLPRFKSMHLRAATFAVNGKPCIVLTDYRGNYPTLWFALMHELHHVLFDWEEILVNSFHLTGDTDFYTESEMEVEANKFARDYLFSADKMKQIVENIDDRFFIEEFSRRNHVHWSIPYIFYAFDENRDEVWKKMHRIIPRAEKSLRGWPLKPFTMSVQNNAKYNLENTLN